MHTSIDINSLIWQYFHDCSVTCKKIVREWGNNKFSGCEFLKNLLISP